MDLRMNGRTNGPTNRLMDRWTDPLIDIEVLSFVAVRKGGARALSGRVKW